MKWLVTGASGYLGKHICLELKKQGEELFGIDLEIDPAFSEMIGQGKTQALDICRSTALGELFSREKFDGVIHLAALKSVSESVLKPNLYDQVNHLASKVLAEIAVEQGIESFIFASSAAVYGSLEEKIYSEEASPNPISPYGLSKLQAEEAIALAAAGSNMKVTLFRHFNIGGSRVKDLQDQGRENLIPIVIHKIRNQEALHIYGDSYETLDGTAIRDYVHIEDVVQAHMKLIAAHKNGKATPMIMNVASGSGTSVREIIDLCFLEMGQSTSIELDPPRDGDVAQVIGSIDRARSAIDYQPQYKILDIVKSSL